MIYNFDNNQLVCDSHMNCMLKDDLISTIQDQMGKETAMMSAEMAIAFKQKPSLEEFEAEMEKEKENAVAQYKDEVWQQKEEMSELQEAKNEAAQEKQELQEEKRKAKEEAQRIKDNNREIKMLSKAVGEEQ